MRRSLCARVLRMLPAYVGGEAAPYEAYECASHLASCERCAAEESRARELLEALQRLARPPSPQPEIADRVLAKLRAARRALGPRAALKWSALGVLLVLIALPAGLPDWTVRIGLRAFTRLGEILDAQAVFGRVVDLLPGLLPSLTNLADAVHGVHPSAGGTLPRAGLFVGLALAFLAAAFVLALLSGGFVLHAAHTSRTARDLSASPASRSFDNPGRLP